MHFCFREAFQELMSHFGSSQMPRKASLHSSTDGEHIINRGIFLILECVENQKQVHTAQNFTYLNQYKHD